MDYLIVCELSLQMNYCSMNQFVSPTTGYGDGDSGYRRTRSACVKVWVNIRQRLLITDSNSFYAASTSSYRFDSHVNVWVMCIYFTILYVYVFFSIICIYGYYMQYFMCIMFMVYIICMSLCYLQMYYMCSLCVFVICIFVYFLWAYEGLWFLLYICMCFLCIV